jgi:hypothetical protein
MEKLTRQEAKKLGVSKCFGSVCEQHPELEGFRWVSGSCVACAKNALNANRNKNRERTSAQRQKDYKKLLQSEVNVEKKKLRGKVYYEKTKALLYAKKQSWLLNNPGKCGLYASRHRQNHPDAKNADTAKRRSDKLKRTPVWLSKDELWLIREAYALAKQRTKMFGFTWHVDHVIPLRGQNVSGLHVPWNLQVIPAKANIAKGNKVI